MSREVEEKILRIFRKSERAISPDTIIFATNAHPRDVSEKLRQLEKYGIIQPVTKRVIKFYKIRKKL